MIVLSYLLTALGSSAVLTSIYVSLYLPWASPYAEVNKGDFFVTIPLQLGLLRCFSSVCDNPNQYYNLIDQGKNLFNEVNSKASNNHTSDSVSNSLIDTIRFRYLRSNSLNLTNGTDILPPPPPIVSPPRKDSVRITKEDIRSAQQPFRRAAIKTIFVLTVSAALSVVSLLMLLFKQCLSSRIGSLFAANILLVGSSFILFVALGCYVLLTCQLMHGGSYIDALWFNADACMLGLICCAGSIAAERTSSNMPEHFSSSDGEVQPFLAMENMDRTLNYSLEMVEYRDGYGSIP